VLHLGLEAGRGDGTVSNVRYLNNDSLGFDVDPVDSLGGRDLKNARFQSV